MLKGHGVKGPDVENMVRKRYTFGNVSDGILCQGWLMGLKFCLYWARALERGYYRDDMLRCVQKLNKPKTVVVCTVSMFVS